MARGYTRGVAINFDNSEIVTERRKIPARPWCKVRINRCVCLCQRSMKGWAYKREEKKESKRERLDRKLRERNGAGEGGRVHGQTGLRR